MKELEEDFADELAIIGEDKVIIRDNQGQAAAETEEDIEMQQANARVRQAVVRISWG